MIHLSVQQAYEVKTRVKNDPDLAKLSVENIGDLIEAANEVESEYEALKNG